MNPTPLSPKKYLAFISYRHADNKAEGRQWATWLHQALETYEIPSDLVGTVNERGQTIGQSIYPIFRDEVELPADSDLSGAITRALDATETLIVLCSPRAVDSTYVADEIDYFKRTGGSSRIIAAIIDGEPNASWDEAKQRSGLTAIDECFPEPLQFEYDKHGQRTNQRAEPIASDFRLNSSEGPAQGWTSKEAHRQALKAEGLTNNRDIEARLRAYEEQKHLMLLKIVASVIGVPLNQLTQRDKAYQLEKEKARNRSLVRWFSIIGVLAGIVVLASFIAYQNNQKAELARQTLRVTEVATNLQSARQAVAANKNEAAIDWLSKNLPEHQPSQKVLSYLTQGYLPPDKLPEGVLQDGQLYARNWDVLLYQNGMTKPIATGRPQIAYLDACTQRVVLGYDQTPNPRLQILDLTSGQLLFEKVWEGERRYFDGPVIPLTETAYLVPTVQAGSYAGANIDELLYLDVSGDIHRIPARTLSYSDQLNTATLQSNWDYAELKDQAGQVRARVEIEQNPDKSRAISLRFTPQTHCTTSPRWAQYLKSHLNLRVGQRRPTVLKPFPLPYRVPEEALWSRLETDQRRNPAATDPQYYAVDYASGMAQSFARLIDYSYLERALRIHSDKTVLVSAINAGTAGITYEVCLLGDFNDETGDQTETCETLESMTMFDNFMKSNPFSRFLPLKHAWFDREKLLTVVELATGRLLPVEPINTDGLSFSTVAFSNKRPLFVGVFGSYLYTYILNPATGSFAISNRAPLGAIDRASDVLSMQLDSEDNALMLLKSGQLLSLNTKSGLVNWETNASNNAQLAYLVTSEDHSQFGLVQDNRFVLMDSNTGIALSRPFGFKPPSPALDTAQVEMRNEYDSSDLSSIHILRTGEVIIRDFAFEERPPTQADIADGLGYSSTYFKLIEHTRQVPAPYKEHDFNFTHPISKSASMKNTVSKN